MRFGYLGNFSVRHSTETHVAIALRANGHHVDPLQENDPTSWARALIMLAAGDVDVLLWTHTQASSDVVDHDTQRHVLDVAQLHHVPTVGFHLDRWWGLNREHLVHEEPFFQVDMMCTADGGHDLEWARAGVNHRWLPPAVLGVEAERLGRRNRRFVSPIAFVGSWQDYHPEWRYRLELIERLRARYGDALALWPRPGEHAIRNRALGDLYASVDVVIGDSCLAHGATRYWSDRIPETTGRGGFLIHPRVNGLDAAYRPGVHFAPYDLGDFEGLFGVVDYYLRNDNARRAIAAAGRSHTLKHHTYEVRMRELVDLIQEELL